MEPSAKTHSYSVNASWNPDLGNQQGTVDVVGIGEPITFSAPAEFHGPGGTWTPEHFFLAAVAGCFVTTFRAVAEFSKFRYTNLDLTVDGQIGKGEGGWQFTRIIVRPTLLITEQADRDRALRLMEKAERACLVSRTLRLPVELEMKVEAGSLAVS